MDLLQSQVGSAVDALRDDGQDAPAVIVGLLTSLAVALPLLSSVLLAVVLDRCLRRRVHQIMLPLEHAVSGADEGVDAWFGESREHEQHAKTSLHRGAHVLAHVTRSRGSSARAGQAAGRREIGQRRRSQATVTACEVIACDHEVDQVHLTRELGEELVRRGDTDAVEDHRSRLPHHMADDAGMRTPVGRSRYRHMLVGQRRNRHLVDPSRGRVTGEAIAPERHQGGSDPLQRCLRRIG